MRCEEPLTGGSERLVEFARNSVGITEKDVSAPLGAIAGYVHQCESRGESEGDVERFGAIDFGRDLQGRWGIGFFVDGDEQTGTAAFLNLRVADGIEFADSGEAGKHLVERLDVNGFADQRLQKVFEMLRSPRVCTCDANELRNDDSGTFP